MTVTVTLARARAALGLGWSASPGASAALVALAVVEGGLPVAGVWGLKVLLDELARGAAAAPGRVAAAAGTLAAAGLLLSLRQTVETYVGATLRRAVQLAAQERLFARVNEHIGLAPFEDPAFLDRLRLAEQAGQGVPEELVDAVLGTVRNGLLIVGYAAALLVIWPPVLAVVAVAAVPSALLHLRMGRDRAALFEGLSPLLRRQMFFRSLLTDARAAKEVRLFGAGSYLHGRLVREVTAAQRAEAALDRRVLWNEGAVQLVAAAVTVVGTAAAAYQALRGRLSVGDVALFLTAVGGLHGAVGAVSGSVAGAYQGLLMFGHYSELMRRDGPRPAAGAPVPALRRGIEFDDVWFRYRDDGPWVLRGVTLTVPHGWSVGLVGLNGAGKSTVVKLLCRLYEPERGAIRWDGVDLRVLDPAALRNRVAAVFQDFMTYDLTAAENVGLGRLDALDDPAALRAAARSAGVDDALSRLPAGYRTLLSRAFEADDGAGGALLSGGQWQRVAVARAFLRDRADLTILDEPSSGLDARAEEEIHAALRRLRAGRTSLLVSHRLGSLREADVIYVLDGGVVAERGRHAELLHAGGRYAELFRLQAAGYRDEVGARDG